MFKTRQRPSHKLGDCGVGEERTENLREKGVTGVAGWLAPRTGIVYLAPFCSGTQMIYSMEASLGNEVCPAVLDLRNKKLKREQLCCKRPLDS